MNPLLERVRTAAGGVFVPDELGEVLLLVYGLLSFAVRDEADTLTVTPTAIQWSRAGHVLGAWRTDLVPPTASCRDALHRMLEGDIIMQRYVQLVDASNGIETFHLGDATTVPRPA